MYEVDRSEFPPRKFHGAVLKPSLRMALSDKPRSGAPAKLDGKRQAAIVALACSDAPDVQARWTAKLLANRTVELEVIESISESTVRRVLKKTR